MSGMKDFMISSPLLYGHVPGGAIWDDVSLCQAFGSLSSHLSALIKEIFVYERRLLLTLDPLTSWCIHVAVTICLL